MADDDFWSDGEDKKKPATSDDALAPIVEVSSETSTATNTARSDATDATEDATPRNE